ncbi:MAG: hypothetical protein RR980_03785 [Mucinivorans sp.]
MKKYFMALLAMCFVLPLVAQKPISPDYRRWDFDSDLAGWRFDNQDQNPALQCTVKHGVVKIWTRKASVDRKKITTVDSNYTSGRYTWRTYISQFGPGDQSSIGSWIYSDDHHEIDFEVGYGKREVRTKLGAAADDLVAYMTTQDFPFASIPVLIKSGWHVFEIDLSLVGGCYFVQWIIDGQLRASVQQTFGSEVGFRVLCSVENLRFIGDIPATQDNYGFFDYVEYTFHR